jgi:hypothetical protein
MRLYGTQNRRLSINPQPAALDPKPRNPTPETLNAKAELKGKKVAVPLCGGNIDVTMLG